MAQKKHPFVQTSQAIKMMQIGGKYLAEVKQILYDFIRPGISLEELDLVASQEILKRNSQVAFKNYEGFPGNMCISVNDVLIHGIPNKYVLKEGDLISIDIGLIYQGYYLDSAFTKSVGKSIHEENEKLIRVAKEAFYAGLKAIKKGATINDISKAVGAYIEKENLFTPVEYSGHGIGKELHQRPYVMNFDDPSNIDHDVKLYNNMVICIEPMILQDSPRITLDKDGWTVRAYSKKKASHYEHTVLIKNYQPVILTKGI